MNAKKIKKVKYPSVKSIKCPRCGVVTAHTLIDYENGTYRCNICRHCTNG